MKSLIVDSSTKILYVALVEDNVILYENYLKGENNHSENIVYCIDEALKQNNFSVDNLDRIIVGYGPGSYTGVRMAVAVCKMLAVFKQKPLYKISTLLLMASGYCGTVKATIDARRGNCFGTVYDIESEKYLKEERMYSYDELNDINCDYCCSEDDFKVNPLFCISHATIVDNPHLLVPNYLRETEAERNLK